ncbi:hypothetical protein L345_13616, partial [Ophiophagus hannah]
MAVLAIYTNPKDPERLTEFYQFKFKYSKNGPQMDFASFHNGTNGEEIKKASILLIRKLYILMQHLGPLPNDITLTMKLFYYKDVTPIDYQPHGFKEGDSSDGLLFDGDPVNLKVGSVSTGFHVLKVRVTTDSKRMGMLENSLMEENGPTEISHQGLDCDDDEEEEDSTKVPEQRKFMAAYVDKNRMFEENAVSQHMHSLNPDITETIRKDGAEETETEKECGTKTSLKIDHHGAPRYNLNMLTHIIWKSKGLYRAENGFGVPKFPALRSQISSDMSGIGGGGGRRQTGLEEKGSDSRVLRRNNTWCSKAHRLRHNRDSCLQPKKLAVWLPAKSSGFRSSTLKRYQEV